MSELLQVNEIYRTIQGESSIAGLPCILVRLTGCNLQCSWCDTQHAQDEEPSSLSIEAILAVVSALGCRRVEVTGGEPLLQPGTLDLLHELCEAGYETLLETNGSVDISGVDPRVRRIMDIKCPASDECDSFLWTNLDYLNQLDEVKFVLADRNDYEFARSVVNDHGLDRVCEVLFSPVWGQIEPSQLASWMLEDNMDVRLGLQLHKIIWPTKERGV